MPPSPEIEIYLAKVQELEAREAQLEAAIAGGDNSEGALNELETVRAHIDWYLEGLDMMGAFNAEPDDEFPHALRAATSCS